MCTYLNIKFSNKIRTININNLNNDTTPIVDNDLNIVITNIFEDKPKNIVPKKSKINITSKENIFIIDKEKYKSNNLDFKKENIDTDTVITTYLDKTYPELKGHYDLKVEGDKDGKFEDGTKITITIKDKIQNITTTKNPDKIYVKVNFEVSDNTKYNLKENILKINNQELELEKNLKYEQLIEKIKKILGGISFKEGFVVLFNNANFTAGNNLTNNGIYTFKLDNEDKNFVEEIIKEVQKEENKDVDDKDNEEEHNEEDDEKHNNDDEEHNNDDDEHNNEDINNINNNNNNNNNNNSNSNDNNKDTKKSNNRCNCCDCNKKSEK